MPIYKNRFKVEFSVDGQKKIICVDKKNNGDKCLLIGNVKYYNYSLIPKSKLKEFNMVSLVL